MLNQTPTRLLGDGHAGAVDESATSSEADIVAFLQRYRWTILGSVLIAVILAGIYVHQTTVLYQARAEIIIDPRLPQMPTRDQTPDAAAAADAALVESQMVVMRSEKIATAVIETLHLDELPVRATWRTALRERVLHWFGQPPAPPRTEFERMRDAIAMVEGGLSVRRIGTSYAFEIAFTAPDAELSARIVNAIADAYVRDQLDSRSDAARQGSAWLEGRIQQLRREMNSASRLVQEFRASHDYRIRARKPSDTAEAGQDGDESITLEELETASQTSRRIYESFLQALAEAVQRQSFPLAGARVITQATRPLKPSHPRVILIQAFAILLGGTCGIGIAILRQSRDTSIRSARHMTQEPGRAGTVELPMIGPAAGEPRRFQKLRHRPGAAHVEAVLAPFSGFSDELRRVKAFATLGKLSGKARTIGIVSAAERDGRSTITSNLAALFAYSGARILIVDADIRDGALTRRFAPQAEAGLLEMLLDGCDLDVLVARTEIANVDILPASTRLLVAHSSDLLGSERMREVLEEARARYDVVILDLPPTSDVADALTVGPMLDGVIAVARAGVTPRRVFSDLCSHLENAQVTVLAMILNMAPRRGARHRRATMPSAVIEQLTQPRGSSAA